MNPSSPQVKVTNKQGTRGKRVYDGLNVAGRPDHGVPIQCTLSTVAAIRLCPILIVVILMSFSQQSTSAQQESTSENSAESRAVTPSTLADELLEAGVSLSLAQARKARISDVRYDLKMDLQASGPIHSSIRIGLTLLNPDQPLILDFQANEQQLRKLTCNGKPVPSRIIKGHILLEPELLKIGDNDIEIEFIAGDPSLNRSEDFLYTLLVPDRASTVFPCFDQPDLKAAFGLQLTLPSDWTASANGRLVKTEQLDGRQRLTFQRTHPISTYLFAFAAGEFQSVTRTINGRSMTLLHRETDQEKVDRNLDDIFRIHGIALEWLEDYTAIKYPFDKFDFVLIPSFQYGGMEHVGNIFYNANALFLEKSATTDQKLNRASLIAHETAHMWFGDLVTMKWFDDVWLKEVFANFMAAKIVHPAFPEINHDLGFLLKHHPSAYGEDRTRGTHPIQQRLDNLRNAGTLYGRIIYMKAPVVMRQLENIIGANQLRDGLREYLRRYSYDNAVWDDLIEILDQKTEVDLKNWSAAWVKQAGAPEIESVRSGASLKIRQLKQTDQQEYWTQQIDIKVIRDGKTRRNVRTLIAGEETVVDLPELRESFDFFLVNASELGYGYFRLDEASRKYLLTHLPEVEDDVTRGAAWLALYESMIRGETQPLDFLKILLEGLRREQEPLNRQNLLGQLETVYWKFLSADQRSNVADEVESVLWSWIESDQPNDERTACYHTLRRLAVKPNTVDRLYQVWQNESDLAGLPLAENDFIELACELAMRLPWQSDEILARQLDRIENADRKKKFRFVIPALAANPATRDAFFARLGQVENRRPEAWVLEGLQYLHHPLRASSAEKYILPSLEMLEEIQATGDIFFPKRWLNATFSGHRSREAAKIVEGFLADHPDYPFRLRNKILQAADLLFKVAGQAD